MKNSNLLNRLLSYSHEKQSPQRFVRYAVMLIMLLTLGVGQMWAGQYNHNWYGNVFFRAPDNWNLSANSKVQVVITRSSTGASEYVCCCNMSQVGSTRLYYAWISWNHSDWKQNEYLAFIANPTTWGDNSGNGTGTFALTSCACYTTPYDYGVNENDKPYLFTPNSESNGATLSGTCYTNGSEYDDRVPSNFNVAQRINLYTNGSSSKTGGSVRIDGIYMTGSTTTGSRNVNNGSNTYASYDACVGSSVTLTATPNTGYQFDGWYTEGTGGSLVSDDNPYSYTCKGTQTLYARFSEKTYSLTFTHNGHGSISVGGNVVASGSTATVKHVSTTALVATANTGYNFTGWTKSGTNASSVTIADMTASGATTTIKSTATDATVTAGFSAKQTTITLNANAPAGKTVTGGGTEVTATYDAALPGFSALTCDGGYSLTGYWDDDEGGNLIINVDGTYADV